MKQSKNSLAMAEKPVCVSLIAPSFNNISNYKSHTLQQGFGKTRVLNCITCIIMPWHHPYFKPLAMQNNVSVEPCWPDQLFASPYNMELSGLLCSQIHGQILWYKNAVEDCSWEDGSKCIDTSTFIKNFLELSEHLFGFLSVLDMLSIRICCYFLHICTSANNFWKTKFTINTTITLEIYELSLLSVKKYFWVSFA